MKGSGQGLVEYGLILTLTGAFTAMILGVFIALFWWVVLRVV